MVTYEDFIAKVIEEITSHYEGNGILVEVKLSKVQKVNGISLDGISIMEKDKSTNICPTIYLNGYFSDYERGRTLESIVDTIIEVNEEHQVSESFDIKDFLDFNIVKENVLCKVINTEWNKELLEDVPHVELLDMSIIFVVGLEKMPDGYITIRNEHLKMWGISLDELKEVAMQNIKKEQYHITDMLSVLMGFGKDLDVDGCLLEDFEAANADSMMYVLTNEKKMYGATILARPEFLEKMATIVGGDIFILPSSVHELIALPAWDTSDERIQELRNMIEEVNSTQVSREERLSNNLYLYKRATKELTIA